MAVAVFGGGEGLGVNMGVGRGVDVRHSSRRWRTWEWMDGRKEGVRLICAGVGVALSRLLYRMVGSWWGILKRWWSIISSK